jgi:uncharacterized integral membrane protein
MQIYWFGALLFGIIIALFAVQNSSPITIRFLWFSAEGVAVSVLVMICAALGAMVTLMFGLGREVRLQWSRRSARRAASGLEKRVAELEKTVEQLTTENAALRTQVDAHNATAGELPRYEAVPVDPSGLTSGRSPDEPPALQGRAPH